MLTNTVPATGAIPIPVSLGIDISPVSLRFNVVESIAQLGHSLAMPAAHLNQLFSLFVLGIGLAWASGISLYAGLLMLGLMGISGNIHLPASLEILQSPVVISVAGVMYVAEFIIVRTTDLDTGWDIVHGFVYMSVGALLAAATISHADPAAPILTVCVGVIGAWVASVSHASRLGRETHGNLTPEIYPRWMAATGGDAIVIAGLWTALQYPVLFALMLTLFLFFSLTSEERI